MAEDSSDVMADKELQKFLTVEKVKTQFHEQVHRITDVCWDKCIDKPSSKLDGRTHTCLINCVERFIDSTLILTNRFAHLLQRSAGAI
ncbi:Mitochondrial import inner membrane translocase subunit Tim8 A, partial [Stegodyphus mimosarum]